MALPLTVRLVALLLTSQPSSEGRSGLVIHWDPPKGCPDKAHIWSRIDALTGGLDARRGPRIDIEPKVTQGQDGQYLITLKTQQNAQTGTRSLSAPTCAEAIELVVLISAMLVQERSTAPVRPAVPASRAETSVEGSRREMKLAVALGALSEIGSLPGITGGLSVGLAFSKLGILRPRLKLYALLPRRTGVAEVQGVFAEALLFGAQGSLCVPFEIWQVELGPCAGLDLGALTGRSIGVDQPTREWTLWLAPSFGVRTALPLLERFRLSIFVEGLIPVSRPLFVVRGVGDAYRVAPISGRLGISAEMNLF